MNRQTIIIIVIAVVLVHAALFYVATHMRSLPLVARPVPRPNFGTTEQTYTDAETGEKFTYREIRVSTKLVDPETLKRIEAERAAKATPKP